MGMPSTHQNQVPSHIVSLSNGLSTDDPRGTVAAGHSRGPILPAFRPDVPDRLHAVISWKLQLLPKT